MRDIIVVAFFLYLVSVAYKRPFIGVAAWAWIALMSPAQWAWGFSNSLRLNLTIVVVVALSYLFVIKDKKLTLGGVGWLVILFGCWTLVTTITNLNSVPAIAWDYGFQFIKVIAFFVFITLIVTKRLHIDTLIWAIVLAISAYAAAEAVKFFLSGGSHMVKGRPRFLRDRNDFAVVINMCIPFVIYLIHVTKHRWLRMGLIGLLVLNVVSIVGTSSRGGFIGLSILAIFFWLQLSVSRKVLWAAMAIILLPVLYQATPEHWRERQATVATAAEEDGSFIGRLWAWKISTLIALDNPVTGGGFRAVMDRPVWEHYAPMTPEFMLVDTPPIPTWVAPKAAHNIYFQVLGDHGFVGLGLFLAILCGCLLVNWKNGQFGRKYEVDWYSRLSTAITLSFVGYCITGANVSLAYIDLPYAVIGLVVVMHQHRASLLGAEGVAENRKSGQLAPPGPRTRYPAAHAKARQLP